MPNGCYVIGHGMRKLWITFLACLVAGALAAADETKGVPWGAQPLSLKDAVNMALEHNYAIRKGRHDLEAAHGLAVQTRAIALPRLRANGDYFATDQTENFPAPPGFPEVSFDADQRWSASLRLVQSVYEG